MCITVFDIVLELGPRHEGLNCQHWLSHDQEGTRSSRVFFWWQKKKKKKILKMKEKYRNIKKKMATSGQLWSTRKKRVPIWIKLKGKEKSHWVESNPIWKTLPCRSLVQNSDSFSESSWMRRWGPTRVECGAEGTEAGGAGSIWAPGLSWTKAIWKVFTLQSPQPEAGPPGEMWYSRPRPA